MGFQFHPDVSYIPHFAQGTSVLSEIIVVFPQVRHTRV
jgi:hypothetical protein